MQINNEPIHTDQEALNTVIEVIEREGIKSLLEGEPEVIQLVVARPRSSRHTTILRRSSLRLHSFQGIRDASQQIDTQ